MEITGTVVDQNTGQPLTNVTIWEIQPDGQSAQIIGFSGPGGKYDVNVSNAGSGVNFVTDGYTGINIPASQALLSDQVLLAPDGSISAKLTLSNIPTWVWGVLAVVGIFLLDKKKR